MRKRQLRDDLLIIVDHINAKGKQNPCNKRVLQAVVSLTDLLDSTEEGAGGTTSIFLSYLDFALGFIPSYKVIYYENKLSSRNFSDLVLGAGKVDGKAEQTNLFPHRPEIDIYCSGKLMAIQYLSWKKVRNCFCGFIQRNLTICRGIIQDIKQRLQQLLRERKPQGGEVELEYAVALSRLGDKLPAGSKLIVHNFKDPSLMEFHGASVAIPYDGDFMKWQKFDLVGFAVHSGFHYVAYVKREGTWYLVNDDRVSAVSEAEMGRLFEGWLAERRKLEWTLATLPTCIIYEARS